MTQPITSRIPIGSSWTITQPGLVYGLAGEPRYHSPDFPSIPLHKDSIIVVLEVADHDLFIGGPNIWYRVASSCGNVFWMAVGAWTDGALKRL